MFTHFQDSPFKFQKYIFSILIFAMVLKFKTFMLYKLMNKTIISLKVYYVLIYRHGKFFL